MSSTVLPFPRKSNHDTDLLNSDLYQMLSPPLQKVARVNLHLLEYLHLVPVSQVGVPSYYPELSYKMGDIKEPNLIYPVGSGLFVHILVDFKDVRHHYISVEPTLTLEIDDLVDEVERICIQSSDRFTTFNVDADKKQQLLNYVDEITTLVDIRDNLSLSDKFFGVLRKIGMLDKYIGRLRKGDRGPTRVKVTQRELEGIRYLFVRDKIGLGLLEPLLADSYIEDIGCSGVGHIFIEHKIFKSLKSSMVFSSLEDVDSFVLRLTEQIKKPVTIKNPIADATLPGGARINVVYGRDVSRRGSNFTIRRFSDVPLSIFNLVDFNTVTYQMLAYLSLILGNGMNVFVAGESASGKTSMLNAISTFIPPTHKIITIEDTPELQLPHENWIREVVQSTKAEDSTGAITMFDLLKAALRQRPDEIMIGEIRGPEGNVAFQAMQTGHSVMATFHAASVEKLIQRLTGKPILVPKTYIDNLNVAILMSLIKLPNGKMGRRITSIAEIVGFDPPTDSFNIIEAFQWDETTDKYTFTGYMTSFILEHKVAPKLGIPSSKKRRIYTEVERRTKLLAKLHKEQGITGFYEVLAILSKAQRAGLF